MINLAIERAASIISECDALLIGAGAGMGVDSGLPDFRGNEGFWRAYPPMQKAGLSFYDLANPMWFDSDPTRAWGFYGHRLNLYRETAPHEGFDILHRWSETKQGGAFVFTSNVDGHFQESGFSADQVVECHGAIRLMQCTRPCSRKIWATGKQKILVDLETFRAQGELPECRKCKGIARPNILMFGDSRWLEDETEMQYHRYETWLHRVAHFDKVAVIEFGAGTSVPTVRFECERRAARLGAEIIRINPRESQVRDGVSIPMGALETIQRIDELI